MLYLPFSSWEYYRCITGYIQLDAGDKDFVLELISDGIPGQEEYPYFFSSMYYKPETDVFWYENSGEFPISSLSLVSSDGAVLYLDEELNENRSFFDFWDGTENANILKFSEDHESLSLHMMIEPSYEFSIPVSKQELLMFLTFSDL